VHDRGLEVYRQVNAVGQSALKSIMLINGGAAVALLAFLGNLVNSHANVALLPFANSMRGFVIGVFLSAVAFATTYLSQVCYSGDTTSHERFGKGLNFLTSLVSAASLVAFLWGSNAAYAGFVAFVP
jgi:hypothetical protein